MECPSHALNHTRFSYCLTGPKLTGGMAGNPMDQRIEYVLADVLALAGEDLDAVREGVRALSPAARRSSGCGSLTIGEHSKLVLSGIDRQVR